MKKIYGMLLTFLAITLSINSMERGGGQAKKKIRKKSAITATIIPPALRRELTQPDILAAICATLEGRLQRSPELDEALKKLKANINYQSPTPFAQADALFQDNHYERAYSAYERLLPSVRATKLEKSQAHMNMAECQLGQGNLVQGFQLLREREKYRTSALKSVPFWDGTPLPDGTRLLIISEQGIGDGFFFVPRFVAALKRLQPKVTTVVQARKAEVPLFKQCKAIDQISAPGEEVGKLDAQVYAMTLPCFINANATKPTTSDTIPGIDKPYMQPSAALVEQWRKHLDPRKINIGIWWRASKLPAGQTKIMHRDIPLSELAQLSKIPNVVLYSLQAYNQKDGWGHRPITENELKSVHAEKRAGELDELDILPDDCRVTTFAADFDTEPFADTAAVMNVMDLLIGCDTAQLCLAGALSSVKEGEQKVIALLPHNPDWRWGKSRLEKTWIPKASVAAWSPAIAMLRQEEPGNWKPLIQQITTALTQ